MPMVSRALLITVTTLWGWGAIASTPAPAKIADPRPMPPFYVGVGVRGGFNDSVDAMIDSKIRVAPLGSSTLSVRPTILIGNDFGLRLPVTVDVPWYEGVYPYAGAGLSYDETDSVGAMVTAGLDVALTQKLYLDTSLGVVFDQDVKAEVAFSLNYAF